MKILVFCFLMCTASVIVSWEITQKAYKKIAVVDAVKLFDAYAMKNDLEILAKKDLERQKKQLDSVENLLEMAKVSRADADQINKLSETRGFLKRRFENDYEESNRDINTKVWKRLNPLLDEFGKENALHLIIGANGMGSVLYNDEFYDRTNEVIKFANKKYAQGN